MESQSLIESIRDIAQFGRAPGLGPGGRRFKSYYPDSENFPKELERTIDSIQFIFYSL